ncbi:MAG: hypothetical protein H0W73_00450 [Bacteroidetes bacterium]|nr:hypothetical protein [Bacteroidota bacterium]
MRKISVINFSQKTYFIFLACFNFLCFSAQETNTITITKLDININTSDTSIQLNESFLSSYKLSEIEKILGKPDRIKTNTYNSYYEEFGTDNMPPTSTPIIVKNYYYIYDKLGVMFYTDNGMSGSEQPEKFSIHLKNKRLFTNTKALPFLPLNAFTGELKINAELISAHKKIIPAGANYLSKEIKLFTILFGPTSIATGIDGLYSINIEPCLFLYLDTEKEQRISCIVVY